MVNQCCYFCFSRSSHDKCFFGKVGVDEVDWVIAVYIEAVTNMESISVYLSHKDFVIWRSWERRCGAYIGQRIVIQSVGYIYCFDFWIDVVELSKDRVQLVESRTRSGICSNDWIITIVNSDSYEVINIRRPWEWRYWWLLRRST